MRFRVGNIAAVCLLTGASMFAESPDIDLTEGQEARLSHGRAFGR